MAKHENDYSFLFRSVIIDQIGGFLVTLEVEVTLHGRLLPERGRDRKRNTRDKFDKRSRCFENSIIV